MRGRALPRSAWLLALSLIFTGTPARADWQADLGKLLKADTPWEQQGLIRLIVNEKPDWRAVAERIRAQAFPDVEKGRAHVAKWKGKDGVTRPYAVYVPSAYDPMKPAPMLVWLHGGVTQASLPEDPRAEAERTPITKLAESKGWLVLFPFGENGATWWDDTGMENVRAELRAAKRQYNVDDDRVWLIGFSDGASAAWFYAEADPTDYAAFVALNGHPSGGSLMYGTSAYPSNLLNTPLYAVYTTQDILFPATGFQPMLDAAEKAGWQVTARVLKGGHDLDYWDAEAPKIARFLEDHPRHPDAPILQWESAGPRFGRCLWLSITGVSEGEPAPWYRDVNPRLRNTQALLGIILDLTHTDGGVPVARVLPDSLAERAGVKAGDILTRGNDTPLASAGDVVAFRSTLEEHQSVTLTVRRDGKEMVLKARVPRIEQYDAFRHDQPSAMARARWEGNRVQIEGSRLKSFRLYLLPEMAAPNAPLEVKVNGRTVYNAKGEPDVAFLLRNYLDNRDRRLLYTNIIDLNP